MAYTFLYTNENDLSSPTIKFVSPDRAVKEFIVTVLNDPAIQPFRMLLQQGQWHIVSDVCQKVRALEPVLIEAAQRFRRS